MYGEVWSGKLGEVDGCNTGRRKSWGWQHRGASDIDSRGKVGDHERVLVLFRCPEIL